MLLYRTWLEIKKSSIKNNVKNIKAKIPGNKLFLGVVKGNGWGCGTVPYANCLIEAGIDWLGVTNIEDALLLRVGKINLSILLLCEIPSGRIKEALKNKLRLTVCTEEFAEQLSDEAVKLGLKANVHIKINTGLNRIGVSPNMVLSFLKYISNLPNLHLEGAFSHFSYAEKIGNKKTKQQLKIFQKQIKKAKQIGIDFDILHIANTAASLSLPETHLDMVRIGMGIAGLYPSDDFKKIIKLYFPLTWKTQISYLRDVMQGETVGYCGRYKCELKTSIVTIPIGYADGLSKKFEGKGFVLIRGEPFRIIAVCMDQSMIDLQGIQNGLKIGEEVVILGKQQRTYLDLELTAKQ
ncbi:alanine racemase, partial [Candidatus Atribacteria bacterium 1244-E10-H5-B2]